jgi:hypothetical protein
VKRAEGIGQDNRMSGIERAEQKSKKERRKADRITG